MRILVMGSGGLGGYFGGLLAKSGQQVSFLARGAHLQALQERGLRVTSVNGDFELEVRAAETVAELGPADLVLFCVKSYDTEAAAGLLQGALAPGGAVLTLQNGIGNAEQIDAVLGKGTTLPGSAQIESAIGEPGLIIQSSLRRRITFGEADGRRSERAERILELLTAAEIETILSDDIQRVLWEKFIFITAMAGLSSLTGATLGDMLGYEPTRALFRAAVEEAAAVGRAAGVRLSDSVVDETLQLASSMLPTMRSSMQKDLEAGRRLEVEALNGMVARLGRQHALPTPINDVIYAVLGLANRER
jgi:2-dehydropantoate 2-reductase